VCASCMINLVGVQLGQINATRKHVIDSYDAIDGRYCSECRSPLFFHAICVQFIHSKKDIAVNGID